MMDIAQVSAADTQTSKHKSEVEFKFGPWIITACKNHILQSKCADPEKCKANANTNHDKQKVCTVCRYREELLLPQLPDMVFGDNVLILQHTEGGFGLEFNALDALKLVDAINDPIKVAVAEAWREARADSKYLKDVVKPFDWTFTTRYKGTITGQTSQLQVTQTNEKIDVEKLKQREKILFYEDVHLFEDELADNGCAQMSVKIRVMPSSFFLLQRFHLRVDNVLIRIHDCRVYHELGTKHVLREFSIRESRISDLQNIAPSILTDPNEVWMHLKLIEECSERLEFP